MAHLSKRSVQVVNRYTIDSAWLYEITDPCHAEYTQALAFDQLGKLMQDGDPTFAGLQEAKIDFPPTYAILAFGISVTHTLVRFKYDVSRTVKQREKPRTRYAHHHSKSSLDEIGDKGHNLDSGITVNEEDYDDELEDAISLRSSAWTSNGSKYQIDAAGDGSEHSGDMPLNHTSKLVSHAAAKAKAAWITFLNASRDVQANNFSTKQRRKTSTARLGMPPSSVESSQATRATSDQSAASLNPPVRRAASAKTSMLHRQPEDEVSHPDIDKGVYDSSSKQRVPSW